MVRVKRALISVHDKEGVVEFAKLLSGLGVEILSTGGTAKLFRDSGLRVIDVSEVTGFPEMLDGRVKTLHPKVHAGILARRDKPEHLSQLRSLGIEPIDLVVVSLYPFEKTVAEPGVSLAEAIEQIDVGGPTMIRAAAKNWSGVAVVVDREEYSPLIEELKKNDGSLSDETRYRLAREAFRRTAQYDAAIAAYLRSPEAERRAPAKPDSEFPPVIRLELLKGEDLRYGENPHQSAAFYRQAGGSAWGVAAASQLHGPELSYNNYLDFSAALGLLLEFDEPASVVIKHTNPCGAATGGSPGEAMRKAKACDPVSIYGGIVGVNRTLDMEVVKELSGILLEILFAPSYEADALEELRRTKKKCRVLELPLDRSALSKGPLEYRSVLGGVLAQTPDFADLNPGELRVVSKRQPTDREWAALRFGWKVAKHVRSNAIVLAAADHVVGVGAGQMNRVDSARLAVMRAREVGLDPKGSVVASDAFFPFRDGLDVCGEAGATAAIHPGGSVRDAEVKEAADERGMALVETRIRHFRH